MTKVFDFLRTAAILLALPFQLLYLFLAGIFTANAADTASYFNLDERRARFLAMVLKILIVAVILFVAILLVYMA